MAFWQPTHAYSVGNRVVDSNGDIQQCTVSGTSGTVAPTWATAIGAVTIDSGAHWQLIGIQTLQVAAKQVGPANETVIQAISVSTGSGDAGKVVLLNAAGQLDPSMGGGGGGSSAFNDITTGTNVGADMEVGTGATLSFIDDGIVNANQVSGVPYGGSPSHAGQVPIVQPDMSVAFADPLVQGLYAEGASVATPPSFATPTTIQPVFVAGKGADGNLHGLSTDNSGQANVLVQNFPGTQVVSGTISVFNFPSTQAVTQSGSWTVGISASQTIAVTNAGTFAVQATQSGTWTVGLSAGSAVIGHVITDTGSTTVVTGTVTVAGTVAFSNTTLAVTNVGTFAVQATGTVTANIGTTGGLALDATLTGGNLVAQAVQSGTWTVDIAASQTIAVTNTGTFAVQVSTALPAGTNVIGHVITDTGSTTAVTGTVTVSGTITANIGTTNGLALDATLTGGTLVAQAVQSGTWTVGISASQTIAVTQTTAANLNATVIGTGTFAVQATQTGTWTVAIAAAQTIAVTNAGTFATQVTSLPALVAGTAIIGKVGIDQTTPGTTNGVQVNAALPAGANIIGQVEVTDGTNVLGTTAHPVVTSLPTSSTAGAPANTAVTSTSGSILASNAARKEVTIVNTDVVAVYIAFGQTPTATAYHVVLTPCIVAHDGTGGTYTSDVWTGAINAITASTSGHVSVTEMT